MQPISLEIRRLQCRHIFTDGHRCGSPCLRGEEFCYFHHTSRKPKAARPHDAYNEPPNETAFTLPPLEDLSAVQRAIDEVLSALARNALDPRRAGLLLYGLQIASQNLKNPSRKATVVPTTTLPVEEVIQDLEHGPLAPAANMPEPEQESGKFSMLEHWALQLDLQSAETRIAELEAKLAAQSAATGLTLHAGREPQPPAPHPSPVMRSRPKSYVRRTLTESSRGGAPCPKPARETGTLKNGQLQKGPFLHGPHLPSLLSQRTLHRLLLHRAQARHGSRAEQGSCRAEPQL